MTGKSSACVRASDSPATVMVELSLGCCSRSVLSTQKACLCTEKQHTPTFEVDKLNLLGLFPHIPMIY